MPNFSSLACLEVAEKFVWVGVEHVAISMDWLLSWDYLFLQHLSMQHFSQFEFKVFKSNFCWLIYSFNLIKTWLNFSSLWPSVWIGKCLWDICPTFQHYFQLEFILKQNYLGPKHFFDIQVFMNPKYFGPKGAGQGFLKI